MDRKTYLQYARKSTLKKAAGTIMLIFKAAFFCDVTPYQLPDDVCQVIGGAGAPPL